MPSIGNPKEIASPRCIRCAASTKALLKSVPTTSLKPAAASSKEEPPAKITKLEGEKAKLKARLLVERDRSQRVQLKLMKERSRLEEEMSSISSPDDTIDGISFAYLVQRGPSKVEEPKKK